MAHPRHNGPGPAAGMEEVMVEATQSYDFAWAIRMLKAGYPVRRRGWNGKGMWVAVTFGTVIPKGLARAGASDLCDF
jgi:hypothetical protein